MTNQVHRYERSGLLRYQDAEFARYYDSQYTGRFRLIHIPARVLHWRQMHIISRWIARVEPRPLTVLDLPCGSGRLACTLAGQRISITAADVSIPMLELARLNYPRRVGHIRGLVRADAAHCPFRDGAFDCVICLALFHRIPHEIRIAMLTEYARVCRRHVIVSYGLLTGMQKFRLRLRDAVMKNVSIPFPVTSAELTDEAEKAGLRIANVFEVLPVVSSEVIVLLEKIGSSRENLQ